MSNTRPVDAFSQEVWNRFRQLPAGKVVDNQVDILMLIACDVAEDFQRDCPEALDDFIAYCNARDKEDKANKETDDE